MRLSPAKSYSPLPLEEGSKSLSIRRRLLSRQLLIGETGWPICCVAQTAALVFFIGFKIALEPFHMTIAFKEIGRHTSELQSLMRISYAVSCLKNNNKIKLQSLQHPHI